MECIGEVVRLMDKDEIRLITKICYMYYFEEEVQSKIAKRFNITRQMVSRLIQKAKDEGILKIIIESPLEEVVELESEMESKFGLKDAIVIQNDTISDEDLIKKLGSAAGDYLNKIMASKINVGIGFGRSIEAMADQVLSSHGSNSFSDVSFVQLTGGMSSSHSYDNGQYLMSLLGKAYDAKMECLNFPLLIEEYAIRDSIIQSTMYSDFLNRSGNIDYAFVQINPANRVYQVGGNDVNSAGKNYLNRLGINYLNNLDAVGEICLNYFNDRGHFVESPLDDKAVTIPSKKLKSIRNLVGIVGGEASRDAALGAIRCKAFDVLVTDEDTARYLLEMEK